MGKQLQTLQHNLEAAVQRADACTGNDLTFDHFRDVTKLVGLAMAPV